MRRALIAASMLLLASCTDAPTGPTAGDPTEGEPAPGATEVVLAGLGEGPEVDLTSYRGRPLVVNFFASTCGPCVEEMPAIQRVVDAAGDELAVLGVAVNDRAGDALALVERTGVDWDLAADPDGSFFRAAGALYMPTTVLVDEDGVIVDLHTGAVDEAELAGLLDEHLGVRVEL